MTVFYYLVCARESCSLSLSCYRAAGRELQKRVELLYSLPVPVARLSTSYNSRVRSELPRVDVRFADLGFGVMITISLL